MSQPPQQDQPEERREDEVRQGSQDPALNQLAEARNEKTYERRDNITGRTLAHNMDVNG
jgi:hypothetical protein